jgi:hypothetical protein
LYMIEPFIARLLIAFNRHLPEGIPRRVPTEPHAPYYGECYRSGERIFSAFVEATVNAVISKRFAKKQQMQWSRRGAHLLLQTRTKTLDGSLRAAFEHSYPA